MISAKSDMHRDEPRESGFRVALQRLREHAIAGHLQVHGDRRYPDPSSKIGSATILREILIIS